MTPTEKVLARLQDAQRAGTRWLARCPAHDDRRASLSIAEGEDGRALLKCHAGCSIEAIVGAMGLRMADLMSTAENFSNLGPCHANGRTHGQRSMVATYDYRDEHGDLLFQTVRYLPKDFRQRQPKPEGGWEWNVKGVRVVPYRLPELLADLTRPVVVVEGEKDCDNLARIGVLATCNAGGAGKWTAEHAAYLRGRKVIILPDNDDAGRNHAQRAARSLWGIAETVRIVELPGLPPKGDVSDWLASGGTPEELMRLVEAAPVWTLATFEPWPELLSFDVLDLPEFPTHALPTALRQCVEAESRASQTPADMAGLLSLAVYSACLARRVVVEPRARLARAGQPLHGGPPRAREPQVGGL